MEQECRGARCGDRRVAEACVLARAREIVGNTGVGRRRWVRLARSQGPGGPHLPTHRDERRVPSSPKLAVGDPRVRSCGLSLNGDQVVGVGSDGRPSVADPVVRAGCRSATACDSALCASGFPRRRRRSTQSAGILVRRADLLRRVPGSADAFVHEDRSGDETSPIELGLHEVGLVASRLPEIFGIQVRLATVDQAQTTGQVAIATETGFLFAPRRGSIARQSG